MTGTGLLARLRSSVASARSPSDRSAASARSISAACDRDPGQRAARHLDESPRDVDYGGTCGVAPRPRHATPGLVERRAQLDQGADGGATPRTALAAKARARALTAPRRRPALGPPEAAQTISVATLRGRSRRDAGDEIDPNVSAIGSIVLARPSGTKSPRRSSSEPSSRREGRLSSSQLSAERRIGQPILKADRLTSPDIR